MTSLRQCQRRAMPGDDPLSLAVRDRWMAEVYAAFKGIFDIEDPTRVGCTAASWRSATAIAGVRFVGFVDRVDRNGAGGLLRDRLQDVLARCRRTSQCSATSTATSSGCTCWRWSRCCGAASRTSAWLYYTRLGQAKKVARRQGPASTETRDKFCWPPRNWR